MEEISRSKLVFAGGHERPEAVPIKGLTRVREPVSNLEGKRHRYTPDVAVDLNNQRLFVAALGNKTVEVLDIKGAKRWAARAKGRALRAR